jgi:hypothetical protein
MCEMLDLLVFYSLAVFFHFIFLYNFLCDCFHLLDVNHVFAMDNILSQRTMAWLELSFPHMTPTVIQ